MGYMQEFERELREKFVVMDKPGSDETTEDVIAFVKEKLLQSYRNGLAAAESSRTDRYAPRQTRRPAPRRP